jgi:hypothetical protein
MLLLPVPLLEVQYAHVAEISVGVCSSFIQNYKLVFISVLA